MKYTPVAEISRIVGIISEKFMKNPEYPCHMTARFTWRVSETLHLVLNLSLDHENEKFSMIVAIAETPQILFSLSVKTENYRDAFHEAVCEIVRDTLNKI